MKRIQKHFLFIIGLTFIFACNSNQQKSSIQLNNGEKWAVNAEMTPHIETANDLLNSFISQEDRAYVKLAENLKEQNNALIQSCTMKGASHDELHKWLYPHMKLIEDLANAADYNAAEPIIIDLKESFNTYHTHFK